MPRMDDKVNSADRLMRGMIYGPPKSRKTTWALQAAEAGFNVIMADFDHSYHVAQSLSPEAQSRIYHLDCMLPHGSVQNPLGYVLMKGAQGQMLWFNEETRQYTPVSKIDPEQQYVKLDFDKFTHRDVLVLDSWTAFITHLVSAQFGTIDATKVEKLEWDEIQKIRHACDLFLQNLTKCKAHVIMVGHAEQYAKRRKDAGTKEKAETAIESIRTQLVSVSRPHAETMPRHFTDCIRFSTPNASYGVELSTKGTDEVDAGSRAMAPFKGKFDDYPFTKFVSQANLDAVADNTHFSSEALVFATGEEIAASRSENAAIKVGAKPTKLLKR